MGGAIDRDGEGRRGPYPEADELNPAAAAADEDSEPLPFALVCAYLEEHGYRRDQIRHLTRGYVRRVLGWPKEKDGSLRQPRPKHTPESQRDYMRRIYWERGYPAHRIDALIDERLGIS